MNTTLTLRISALAALLLLGACASKTQDSVQKAALTPFSDLNLVRAEVPAVLQAARSAPYALAAQPECEALRSEISALDEVLGPDLDQRASQDKPGLLERGGEADQAAGKALVGAAEGAIPFRGWIRRLSGAERYERGVAAAITAGGIRRAFLKGVAAARACPAPVPAAAPASPAASEAAQPLLEVWAVEALAHALPNGDGQRLPERL
jgi:hypothetical protein